MQRPNRQWLQKIAHKSEKKLARKFPNRPNFGSLKKNVKDEILSTEDDYVLTCCLGLKQNETSGTVASSWSKKELVKKVGPFK